MTNSIMKRTSETGHSLDFDEDALAPEEPVGDEADSDEG
jgi:hypothetical protein